MFETDIYCKHSGSFGHFAIKNVGFAHRFYEDLYKKFQQRKCIPRPFYGIKCDACNIFQFVGLKLVYKGG